MLKRRIAAGAAALSLGLALAGCAPAEPQEGEWTMAGDAVVPAQTAAESADVQQTLTYHGIVAGAESDGAVTIQTEQDGDLVCMTDADTIFIDAVTGRQADLAAAAIGTSVSAAVSPALTRSVPPQAACFAMIIGVPQSSTGRANYVQAASVSTDPDGALEIMNQNDDLIVTIPADVPIELLGGDGTVPPAEIVPGSRLIVWYDAVTMSMPAQAVALRAVFCA